MKGEREHSYPHTQTPFVMSTAASFLQIAKRDSSDLSWHVRRIKIPIRCKTRLERKVSARSKNLAWYRTYHDNWQWHFRGGWLLVIVKGCVLGLVETGNQKVRRKTLPSRWFGDCYTPSRGKHLCRERESNIRVFAALKIRSFGHKALSMLKCSKGRIQCSSISRVLCPQCCKFGLCLRWFVTRQKVLAQKFILADIHDVRSYTPLTFSDQWVISRVYQACHHQLF